jgi:hypothetical protein
MRVQRPREEEPAAEEEATAGEEATAVKVELAPIAVPLAGKKLTKRLFKVVKKGACGRR